MSGIIDPSDLPSWILIVLMGFGVAWANGNGVLTGFDGLGKILVFAGLFVGAFHILNDISNKL